MKMPLSPPERAARMTARRANAAKKLKFGFLGLGGFALLYVIGVGVLALIPGMPKVGQSPTVLVLAPAMLVLALSLVILGLAVLKGIGSVWDGLHGGFEAEADWLAQQAASDTSGDGSQRSVRK